jgi:hypothetical protein
MQHRLVSHPDLPYLRCLLIQRSLRRQIRKLPQLQRCYQSRSYR